jgi:hypothetical protein
MATTERTITERELDARFAEILEEIARDGVVYIVETGDRDTRLVPSGFVDARGTIAYVLGPPEICGRVCGLYDGEYGWPVFVDVGAIRGADDLAPGRRRHPHIARGGTILAVSVMIGEYEEIKRLPPTP